MVRSTYQSRSASKKSLNELKSFLTGESGAPIMLVEGQLIERFGWTFNDLDQQDSGRTLQTVTMLNMAKLYPEVLQAVAVHKIDRLTDAHWNAYKLMNALGQGDE